ncbi:SET domain-containing protein-lysine N-methyltransferase [Roseofilum casamattae]|uniref:SET domain-containing protein-lysine N-methyltransferase n=1 Tax=Roseofilum casamattae BLCC-M143 TaxID=3022442 RepID=A0ABT7BRC8_9CYAN|nr:SET domain-containing protein-lysine N-methyltransferase [Roseofilum casamattae]MDJ1181749.1 SET domain-containing protein-lysine N-methyltransferase [Roseofilum casamattae BLCC-M143]
MIEIKLFPQKGRGVIATELIHKGTLIEQSPVVVFPTEQRKIIDKTEVFRYYFVIPAEYSESKEVGGYLVFGLASFCNHSDTPNTRVDWVKNETGLWAHLLALEDIQPGAECLLFYTNVDEYPANW